MRLLQSNNRNITWEVTYNVTSHNNYAYQCITLKSPKREHFGKGENKMKFVVYTFTVFSIIGGLTLLSLNSNTVLPYQPLSITEMLETQGAVACTTTLPVTDLVGDCGDKPCAVVAWLPIPVPPFVVPAVSKTQTAVPYDDCLLVSPNTDCFRKNEQKCAEFTLYIGPGCIPALWFYNGETMTEDAVVEPGCVGGGGSSS